MSIQECHFGTLRLLKCLDPDASRWLAENAHIEPWQWQGEGLAVEPRMAREIISAFIQAGGHFWLSPHA